MLLAEAGEQLRGVPKNWPAGVVDPAIAAAAHLSDTDKYSRYPSLRARMRHQRTQQHSPGPAEAS
ncbi:hypothetical protein [Streptomyces sp. SGAir0957]